MKWALVVLIGLSLPVFAEDSSGGEPRQPQGQGSQIIINQQQQGSQGPQYRGVPIFNDKVFDSVGKEPEVSNISKSPLGAVRYAAPASPVNSGVTENCKKVCKDKQETPSEYRGCYAGCVDGSIRAVEEQRSATERRGIRSMPTNPVSEAEGVVQTPESSD